MCMCVNMYIYIYIMGFLNNKGDPKLKVVKTVFEEYFGHSKRMIKQVLTSFSMAVYMRLSGCM